VKCGNRTSGASCASSSILAPRRAKTEDRDAVRAVDLVHPLGIASDDLRVEVATSEYRFLVVFEVVVRADEALLQPPPPCSPKSRSIGAAAASIVREMGCR
jgi:hypothetical protein